MKKIISIILILCMIFLLASCNGPPIDKDIYGAEDWSYLMVHGTKYVRVEQPFIIGSNRGVPDVFYDQRETTNLHVFTYEETQRYPWVGGFNNGFQLFEVTLPNDINIKFLEECGSYCLPEDKETVENMLANISWSEESLLCRLVFYPYPPFVPLSEELSSVLIAACDSFPMQDTILRINEATSIMNLYQYDTQGMLRREFGSIYARGDEIYVFPAENLVTFSFEGEAVDCNWEDLSSQKIPEEFHDEIMTLYDTYKDANQ